MTTRPDLVRLGCYIRERRVALGLTQAQLATRTDTHQERISLLEQGKYGMPSLPHLVILAAALEVPLSDLIIACGDGESLWRPPLLPEASAATGKERDRPDEGNAGEV